MLELEAAITQILAMVPAPKKERVPLAEAHERVLLAEMASAVDLPGFDNSAMDGYAVRSSDVAHAALDNPIRLKIIAQAPAGRPFRATVRPGATVRLFTGSMLPAGADAVVMQEDTRLGLGKTDEVLVLAPCKPWENVRLRGEDLRKGTKLVAQGQRLTAGRLALLAATGLTELPVGRRPVIGLLATGSELREPGARLKIGQIYESNRVALAALSKAAGALPKLFPLVSDDLLKTRKSLALAFDRCDIVVTSGGVSVGEMDFVKQAFEDEGGKLEFWKVAIKPGRPFVVGRHRKKLLFGLPGNPVSALVTFLLLVRPALLRWQGAVEVNLPACMGALGESVANFGERRHFMRVRMTPEAKVYSAGTQASHMLSSLAAADGLLDLPPNANLAPGTSVSVMRWP